MTAPNPRTESAKNAAEGIAMASWTSGSAQAWLVEDDWRVPSLDARCDVDGPKVRRARRLDARRAGRSSVGC